MTEQEQTETEREPSFQRMASLLLGTVTAAYGALVELRDIGWTHEGPEAAEYIDTYWKSVRMSDALFEVMGAYIRDQAQKPQNEQQLNMKELQPVLDAIGLMSAECARLSALAAEQADIDLQFQEIADRLKQGGLG